MAGLVLNLKPYEKFIVGSVVLQNGARRTQVRVLDPDAGVLRAEDALNPEDVNSPLTRAYEAAQALLVDPKGRTDGHAALERLLDEARDGFSEFPLAKSLEGLEEIIQQKQYYKLMKRLKPLLAKEAALLLQLPGVALTS
ncbi:MAG: flagellar biosynthesis repressor FlbT [Parvularcula sp.]